MARDTDRHSPQPEQSCVCVREAGGGGHVDTQLDFQPFKLKAILQGLAFCDAACMQCGSLNGTQNIEHAAWPVHRQAQR